MIYWKKYFLTGIDLDYLCLLAVAFLIFFFENNFYLSNFYLSYQFYFISLMDFLQFYTQIWFD